MPASRDDIRNVAIVAHVDHGKTTLIDAMLWQSGAFRAGQEVVTRVLDSMDLEREKGITILAKNASLHYKGVKLNIIDTPGHADFGGEVERGLTMVDGVLLLVDASEGPLPQTRFVLRKTLQAGLPVVLVINKVDRSDARVPEVIDEVYELFLDLDADESQIEFPIVYCNAKAGHASLEYDPATSLSEDLSPLLDLLLEHIPAPTYEPDHPLQALVTNLDASPYVGRLAVCRVRHGSIRKGQQIAWCRADGSIERAQVAELYVTETLERVDAAQAGPGEIIAVAGIADVTIGETLADPDDPRPLEVISVDEPAMSITVGVNTAPLAGREGDKMTARQIQSRLQAELVGNVSLRVLDARRPDAWEVQGRGELQLAVLVEMMRREGFELTVGQPRVVEHQIEGERHEPVERLSIDVPEEFVGTVTQLLAARKGRMEHMTNHGTGWVRLDYLVPSRGLIGFRTEFLTETRGTGIMHHVFDRWEPWMGELVTRTTGALLADRRGVTATYSLMRLQERGALFVGPGEEVYEGMVIGENARSEDLDVNPTEEKHLTNMRSSTADVLVRLQAHHRLTLDEAMEFVREDECIEVTPGSVRVRKVVLPKVQRLKTARLARKLSAAAQATASGSAAGVQLRSLAKSFRGPHGPIRAVRGIDVEIASGETVALLGPNGAGKSTTIDMLLGLLPPDAGSVSLFGRAPAAAIAAGAVGAMLQTGALIRDLTVRELLRMLASLYPAPLDVEEVIELAGAGPFADQRTEKLSGGQTQRVRFAVALVSNPRLLVLDEPTVAMDVEGRHAFWETMRDLARGGRTVLFATHYLEEADTYADRVVLMAGGRLVADGPPTEIKARVGMRTIRATLPGVDVRELEALAGVSGAERRGEAVVLACSDSDTAIRALLAAHSDARDIEISSAGLEEAFLELTAAGTGADDGAAPDDGGGSPGRPPIQDAEGRRRWAR